MDNKLTIRVNIAERYYPLNIDRSEEEKIRKAVKKINDTVVQYRKVYSDKDEQDFLAMVALQFVTRLVDKEEHYDIQPILDNIRQFDEVLTDILEQD
jgi:cell division protein ZapA